MSTPTQEPVPSPPWNRLTRFLFTLGLPAGFAGLTYISPLTALLTPILMSPTMLAAYQRQRLPVSESGNFNTAVRVYSFNAIFGPMIASAFQLPFSLVLGKLLFGAQAKLFLKEFTRHSLVGLPADLIDARKDMARSPRYIFSLAVFSYILAGLVEESMKYLSLRLALLRSPPTHERHYLIYAISAGIGFATLENVGFVYAAIKAGDVIPKFALTVVERSFFSIVGHGVTAALTAMKSVRRDSRGEKMPIWRTFARAAVYHGTFDFMLFCVSAFNGNVGWIHPTDIWSNVLMYTLGLGLQGSLVLDFWKECKRLKLGPCH